MKPVSDLEHSLDGLRDELSKELQNILQFWMKTTPDLINGGFVGKVDNQNNVFYDAPKGSVLNARILWSFSAAFNLTGEKEYLEFADKAYRYIVNYFIDKEHGGVFWTVNANGSPLDTKKQVYAIAFTIYAFAEFYLASKVKEARTLAIQLYSTLVEKSFDTEKKGYFEAFTQNWSEIEDLRLSAKDANEKKTMNTHLHVLEAYTTLYRIWKDENLKEQITHLIHNFHDHIIDTETGHLILFHDEDWNPKSDTISYGHDIEAAWLLLEAAEVIENESLISKVKETCLILAKAASEGLETGGSLYYEFEPSKNHLIKEKHWWVQAEAIVGFFNAWQLSRNQDYLHLAQNSWQFTKNYLLDTKNGEWFWGLREDNSLMEGEDKAGLWKCPYHNSRACMEIIRRVELEKQIAE